MANKVYSKICPKCLTNRVVSFSLFYKIKRKESSGICKVCSNKSIESRNRKRQISIKLGLTPPSRLGAKMAEESKLRISTSNKGKKKPEGFGQKIGGVNSYRWITDRTLLKDDSKERGGQLHREWSNTVKNRDSWTCRIADNNCDGRLEAHHILGWTKHPKLRYEVNNGITLCHFHHPRKRSDEVRLSPFFKELIAKIN